MNNFIRKKPIACIYFSLLINGCAGLSGEPLPEWIFSPQKNYPSEKFLTGIGEAKSRAQAENRAFAAIAKIFSANVTTQSTDQESYSIQETPKANRSQRTLELNQRTQVTTRKVLENVQVLKTWRHPSTQRFYVLAGLNRQQAERAIMERLTNEDLIIADLIEQGRTNSRKIQRIRGYKKALARLINRNKLNIDLRVIQHSGKSHPSSFRLTEIQREFQDFVANELMISIVIQGTHPQEMKQAIIEGLKQEGLLGKARTPFKQIKNKIEDLVIIGHGKIWPIDIPDPLFQYVRWCGHLDIYENPSQQLIGIISKAGREGHITKQEANVRANRVMQQVLSQEIAQFFNNTTHKPSLTNLSLNCSN